VAARAVADIFVAKIMLCTDMKAQLQNGKQCRQFQNQPGPRDVVFVERDKQNRALRGEAKEE